MCSAWPASPAGAVGIRRQAPPSVPHRPARGYRLLHRHLLTALSRCPTPPQACHRAHMPPLARPAVLGAAAVVHHPHRDRPAGFLQQVGRLVASSDCSRPVLALACCRTEAHGHQLCVSRQRSRVACTWRPPPPIIPPACYLPVHPFTLQALQGGLVPAQARPAAAGGPAGHSAGGA